jgi:hypothetical protein
LAFGVTPSASTKLDASITGYLVASPVRVRVNTSVEDARRKLALSKLSDEDVQALGLTRD